MRSLSNIKESITRENYESFRLAAFTALEQSDMGAANRLTLLGTLNRLHQEHSAGSINAETLNRAFQGIESNTSLTKIFTNKMGFFQSQHGRNIANQLSSTILDANAIKNLRDYSTSRGITWNTMSAGEAMTGFREFFGEAFSSMGNKVKLIGGQEALFDLHGFGQQRSTVYGLSLELGQGRTAQRLNLPLYQVSSHGILAGGNLTSQGTFSQSSAVYNVPGKFLFNPLDNEVGWRTGGFHQYQQSLLKTTHLKAQEISASNTLTFEAKEKALRELESRYKNELTRFQYYVGHQGEFSMSSEVGLKAMQGRLDRAAIQSQRFVFAGGYEGSRYSQADRLKLMTKHGGENVYFHLQPTPTSKGQGLELVGKMFHTKVETHREPLKALGEITPMPKQEFIPGTVVPRSVQMFGSLTEEGMERTFLSNDFAKKAFAPTGVQSVVGFMPEQDPFLIPESQRSSVVTRNLVSGDGVIMMSSREAKSGAYSFVDRGQYRVKLTDPAYSGGAPVINKQLADIINKIGDKSMQDKLAKGIALEKNMVLGVNPSSGELIYSANRQYINESIVGIGYDEGKQSAVIFTNRYVDQSQAISPQKLVGEGQMKGQVGVVSNKFLKTYEKALRGRYDIETQQGIGVRRHFGRSLKEAGSRAEYMAGALKFELANTYHQQMGAFKKAQQSVIRQEIFDKADNALGRILGSNAQDLIGKISSGTIIKDLEALNIKSPLDELTKQMLADETISFEQKLARITYKTIGQFDTSKDALAKGSLANVLAPYTQWSKSMGAGVYSSADPNAITERYFNQARQAEGATRHQVRRELIAATDENVANAVLGSRKEMAVIAASRMRDQGLLVGEAVRGSIEPRFFDIARLNPEMAAPFRELTGRMSDYSRPARKLLASVTGRYIDSSSITAISHKELVQSSFFGHRDFMVDLGLSAEKSAALGYASGKIYVPGGEAMGSMREMSLATGRSKARGARAAYESLFQAINKYSAPTFSHEQSLAGLRVAGQEFREAIGGTIKEAFYGVPGGSTQALMRGTVRGSQYVMAKSFGEIAAGFYGGAKNRHIQLALEHMKTDKSVGRYMFVSKATAGQMFSDLIAGASDSSEKARIKQISEDFRRGKAPMMGVAWRHPGIGIKSVDGVKIFLDDFTEEAKAGQHFVRTAEEYLQGKIKSGAMLGMAGDVDGDRINLSFILNKEGKEAIQKMIASQSDKFHALEYNAIKQTAETSIKHLSAKTVTRLTEKEASAFAAGTVKHLTPKISLAMTWGKQAVINSTLDNAQKSTIMRMLEAGEQTLISGKHLLHMGEYAKDITEITQRAFDLDAKNTANNVKEFINIFSTTADGSRAATAEFTFQGEKRVVNFNSIEKNLVQAIDEFRGKEGVQSAYKILRKKSSTISDINELQVAMKNLMSGLSQVTAYSAEDLYQGSKEITESWTNKTGAQVSHEMVQSINNAAKSKMGQAALSNKGLMALGAVTAAASLTLSSIGRVMSPVTAGGQTGGQNVNPDYLFPEHTTQSNKFLHSAGIQTPQTTVIPQGQNITIHGGKGQYNKNMLFNQLGSLNSYLGGGSSRVDIMDNQMSLDAFTLSRIKNEII